MKTLERIGITCIIAMVVFSLILIVLLINSTVKEVNDFSQQPDYTHAIIQLGNNELIEGELNYYHNDGSRVVLSINDTRFYTSWDNVILSTE